jgi:hypothetical protein
MIAMPAFHRSGRAVALLTLGALALHQLRYTLAFGETAPAALHDHGHDYLALIAPALATIAVAVAASATLARALRGASSGARRAVPSRALHYAAALLAVYAAQELTEGALSPGHPSGLPGLVAEGGWIAMPLALALGLIAALVARVLDRVEEELAVPARRPRLPRPPAATPSLPATSSTRPPLAALTIAFGLARRPPPALQVR